MILTDVWRKHAGNLCFRSLKKEGELLQELITAKNLPDSFAAAFITYKGDKP